MWWTPYGIVDGKCAEPGCMRLTSPSRSKPRKWCDDHRTAKRREQQRQWAATQRPSRSTTSRRSNTRGTDIDIIAVELACNGQRVVLNRSERRTAVAVLTSRGRTAAETAELLHILERTVERDRAVIKSAA
jgi:DNA-binding NarL/FixJ family response regulator